MAAKSCQPGWRIEALPSGSLRAWSWDPELRTYARKTFPASQPDQARKWAQDHAARYRLGLDRAPGGISPTRPAGEAFALELRRRRRVDQHVEECERVLDGFARAVPDLAAPDAERLALDWWDALPDSRERRREGVEPKPLTPETCNRYLIFVRAMCDHAKEEGATFTRSPVSRIRKLPLERKLKGQFTVEELRTILGQEGDAYCPLFALMVLAGLRIGEACGLCWGDIDWSGKVLAIILRDGVRIKRRKERLVPMMPDLVAILERAKARAAEKKQLEAAKALAKGEEPPALDLTKDTVAQHSVGNGHRDFRRFLERCGITHNGRGPHACRHTYAGLMTATGVPSIMLADYMGHESVATTTGYSSMATRFRTIADGWKRGEFRIFMVP